MGKVVEERVQLGLLRGCNRGVDKDGVESGDNGLPGGQRGILKLRAGLTSFADNPAAPNLRGKALKISGDMCPICVLTR